MTRLVSLFSPIVANQLLLDVKRITRPPTESEGSRPDPLSFQLQTLEVEGRSEGCDLNEGQNVSVRGVE
jgi:hypothetical protein